MSSETAEDGLVVEFGPSAPADVVAAAVGDWIEVEPTGTGRVWLTATHAVKAVPVADAAELDADAANREWLGGQVRTADVVLRTDSADAAWLVSHRLAGVPAHRPDLHGDVGSLAEVAGAALRELHSVPLDVVPAEVARGWDAIDGLAEATVAAGVGEVDEPYQRYTGQELLDLLRQGRPDVEDLVVCHGDPALPNVVANQGVFSGWVDLGGVRVADRHFDLAHAHHSIHRNLGPEAVYVFYDAYGQDPDLLRLDHYLLAKQILP